VEAQVISLEATTQFAITPMAHGILSIHREFHREPPGTVDGMLVDTFGHTEAADSSVTISMANGILPMERVALVADQRSMEDITPERAHVYLSEEAVEFSGVLMTMEIHGVLLIPVSLIPGMMCL
jgi:hypothetical protein